MGCQESLCLAPHQPRHWWSQAIVHVSAEVHGRRLIVCRSVSAHAQLQDDHWRVPAQPPGPPGIALAMVSAVVPSDCRYVAEPAAFWYSCWVAWQARYPGPGCNSTPPPALCSSRLLLCRPSQRLPCSPWPCMPHMYNKSAASSRCMQDCASILCY